MAIEEWSQKLLEKPSVGRLFRAEYQSIVYITNDVDLRRKASKARRCMSNLLFLVGHGNVGEGG